ncbi:hypothetical protein L1049_024583 [Liquidambar formosana]|uniref:Uncharacterized protein n=1 Tax=Liquidambar formosana TaxID=63359 RepID=A0AAP0S0U6_LIQFO
MLSELVVGHRSPPTTRSGEICRRLEMPRRPPKTIKMLLSATGDNEFSDPSVARLVCLGEISSKTNETSNHAQERIAVLTKF